MSKVTINIKADMVIKTKAQKVAADLGMPLSTIINAYLHQLVRTKRVDFAMDSEPTPYLKKAIKEAEADYKAGRTYHVDKAEDLDNFFAEASV